MKFGFALIVSAVLSYEGLILVPGECIDDKKFYKMMKVGFALLISAAFCYAEYAKPGDFPYFALLETVKKPHCAGIILTEGLVLASGICARNLGFEDTVIVTVGTVQLNSKEIDSKRASLILEAEEYESDPRAQDIAFFAMAEKFEFNSNVKPATKFYDYNFDESDKNFREVGFTTKDELPDKLENFEVKSMLYNYCTMVLSYDSKSDELSDSTICLWRNLEENKPNAGYLLTSEDGDVVGLAKYFSYSEDGPDLFILVNKYVDIINATIIQHEKKKLIVEYLQSHFRMNKNLLQKKFLFQYLPFTITKTMTEID